MECPVESNYPADESGEFSDAERCQHWPDRSGRGDVGQISRVCRTLVLSISLMNRVATPGVATSDFAPDEVANGRSREERDAPLCGCAVMAQRDVVS